MPNLNVISWNSTGEGQDRADRLLEVINDLVAYGWQPHVIVIQEANQTPGGNIYRLLASLGNAYNQPPSHAAEGGLNGRGYLMLTHRSVVVTSGFQRYDLGQDGQLLQLINQLSPRYRNIALEELPDMHMPAIAGLFFNGTSVGFLTWHTPRGPGRVLEGLRLKGEANPDAFFFLQNSGLYAQLTNPGFGNISAIGADLNVTVEQINGYVGFPGLNYILQGWVGLSNNLDHIVGYPQPIGFPVGWNFAAPGTHAILAATANW